MTCQEAIDLMGEAVEGRLQPVMRSPFDEHMAECTPCATYLQHLRVTIEALQHLPREEASIPRRTELIETFRLTFDSDDSETPRV